MLSKKWLAGAILGAFLTVTAGAGIPQAQASALPTISNESSIVSLAKHPGDHKSPQHDKYDKHDKKYDKHDKHDKHYKHDKKHDKKYDKKHDKKHDKKKHDRKHDRKSAPHRR